MDLDPDFGLLVVVFAEPLIETLRVLERADVIGIDLDGCHQQSCSVCRSRLYRKSQKDIELIPHRIDSAARRRNSAAYCAGHPDWRNTLRYSALRARANPTKRTTSRASSIRQPALEMSPRPDR